MAINNRVVLVPGIDGFRLSPASYYGTAAAGTGAGSGPAGSSSMLFFCLMYQTQLTNASATLFGRTNRGTGGWEIIVTTAGLLIVRAFNSTPAFVSVSTTFSVLGLEGQNVPYLILGSYQNGTMSGWINGVSMGAPVTLGAGYTPFAAPTTLGVRATTLADVWTFGPLSDSGMLDTYDVGTYVDPMFGNGGPGLSARWLEDLRQGRYFTWPRAAVANSDWYWAGRDVVVGPSTVPSWMDRFSATPMLKFGSPQGAGFPARPI